MTFFFFDNMVKFILTFYHLTPQPPPPHPHQKIWWLSTVKAGNDLACVAGVNGEGEGEQECGRRGTGG